LAYGRRTRRDYGALYLYGVEEHAGRILIVAVRKKDESTYR
jgi:hypothetical protein